MSIKPYVYRYVPGTANTASHLNGIKRSAEKSQELGRSWLVASDTGTGTSRVLTIGHKSEPYLLRLRASSTTDIFCSFSHDGLDFSPEQEFCADLQWTSSNFGAATDKAWVVETEATFSIYTKLVGSQLFPAPQFGDSFSFSCHAGKIATGDNLNDDEETGTFGILCGVAAPIAITVGPNSRALAVRTLPPSQIRIRGQWEQIRVIKSFLRGIHTNTAFFDGDERYTAALGDNSDTERLSPIRVYGNTSGTVANLRFWRARNFAVGQSDNVGLIYSNDEAGPLGGCRQSSADPNIWWRHSANNNGSSGGNQNVPMNIIYIWGDPSEMILV
jgi:hypothetical protein